MRKEKVRSNYTYFKDKQLNVFSIVVLKAMRENEHFPNPMPSIAELQALSVDYSNKLALAFSGAGRLAKSLKREARLDLLQGLAFLAHYVNYTADGNLVMLNSSGLVLAKKPSPLLSPEVVTGIKLSDTNHSGQIRVDFDSQKIVHEYEMQVGEKPYPEKQILWGLEYRTTSSRRNVIPSMVPGKKYYVRVRGRNGKGIGEWSEIGSLIAR